VRRLEVIKRLAQTERELERLRVLVTTQAQAAIAAAKGEK
jgi:hypothetical protein